MSTYARIENSKIAEFFETADDISQLFHPSLIWIDVTNVTPAPKIGWNASNDNGSWTFTEPLIDAVELWKIYQQNAKYCLDKSDITILRCLEFGVAIPAAWITYRNDLRAIISAISGDHMLPLPTKPAYPAGT